jgi:outer membrane protein
MTTGISNWRTSARWLVLALLGAGLSLGAMPGRAAESTVMVAVVTDGPMAREELPVAQLLQEAQAVLDGDPHVEIPARLQRHGGWSIAGINAALDAALADPEVDVIVTLGLISSNQAARRSTLQKPVIAPFVADPVLEGYPLVDGHSGRRNFTYIADFIGLKPQLDSFLKMTGSRHLAAVVDELLLASIPDLERVAGQLRSELGARITLVPAGISAAQVVQALPADADAIFVTPMQRMTAAELQQLVATLQQRRLPTMATTRSDVETGFLMANTGDSADNQRIARRIALNIQRIHAGENAADLEVALVVQPPDQHADGARHQLLAGMAVPHRCRTAARPGAG